MAILNRIPYHYFITKGAGTSKYEIHAGSYHMALFEAGISDFNIQTYSSVLPATAIEIKPSLIRPPFGSELYTIMSCIHGKQDDYLSCGIIIGDLLGENGKIGSLVCEVSGDYNVETELPNQLQLTIDDLHKRTYNQYELKNIRSITNSLFCDDAYGTCLTALCFVSFQEIDTY